MFRDNLSLAENFELFVLSPKLRYNLLVRNYYKLCSMESATITKPIVTVMYGICVTLLLSGCSIGMALHGHPEPNFDAFEVGSTRKQAELQLGIPTSSKALEGGKKEDTYKYEMGNSPNGARATLYFYYDLATFGFAEPIFSLIEVFQGHDEETRIVYSLDDHILEIKGFRPPPPSLELKAAQEAQQQHIKRPKTEGFADAVEVGNPHSK